MKKDKSLYSRQVDLLYADAPPVAMLAVFVSLVLALTSYFVESGLNSFFWMTAMLLSCGSRSVLTERYHHRQHQQNTEASVWERRFIAGALASGVVWGLAPWVLFTHELIIFKFFLYTILSAVAAISISSYSSRLIAYAALVLPMFLLTALETLRHGGLLVVLGGMFCATAMVLLRISWRYQSSTLKMLELEDENDALLEEVAAQKAGTECVRMAERRAADALEEAGIFTWSCDGEINLIQVSLPFLRQTGLDLPQLQGKPMTSLANALLHESPGFNSFSIALQNRDLFREHELHLRCINGARLIVQISGKPVFDSNNEFAGFRGFIRDVTANSTTIENLKYQAQHDMLTGLINHREFVNQVAVYVPPVNLKGLIPHVVYIDIQRLKVLNENLGLSAGDELFCELAGILNTLVVGKGVAARLGGGAFALLLAPGGLEEAIETVQEAVSKLEDHRFEKGGFTFSVDARAGIVGITPQMETAEMILGLADRACRSVEVPGSRKYCVYHDDLIACVQSASSESLAKILSDLDADNLCLQYQPIVALQDNATSQPSVKWFEALLATRDTEGRISLLGQQLAAAEKHGVIARFDRWALDAALKELSQRPDLLQSAGLMVNVSPRTICDPAFADFVLSSLQTYRIAASQLCIDITETLAFKDLQLASQYLQPLVDSGCKISLDDFGTGSSSLEYLKFLSVNYLKVNHVFLSSLESSDVDKIICQTIVELAAKTGCEVIAESVEQLDFTAVLLDMGISLAQGHALGLPTDLPKSSQALLPGQSDDSAMQAA